MDVSAVEQSGLTSLKEGDEVSFELQEHPRTGKPRAADIEVILIWPPDARAGTLQSSRGKHQQNHDAWARYERVHNGFGMGVVKWLNVQNGFDFIQAHDGSDDVFVHASARDYAGLRSLNDGQPVAYEIEGVRRTGKIAATNLRLS